MSTLRRVDLGEAMEILRDCAPRAAAVAVTVFLLPGGLVDQNGCLRMRVELRASYLMDPYHSKRELLRAQSVPGSTGIVGP